MKFPSFSKIIAILILLCGLSLFCISAYKVGEALYTGQVTVHAKSNSKTSYWESEPKLFLAGVSLYAFGVIFFGIGCWYLRDIHKLDH
jgi:photosystem II stability/assembly factor-like uncharacterized protein